MSQEKLPSDGALEAVRRLWVDQLIQPEGYEDVPWQHIFTRPRYQHLRDRMLLIAHEFDRFKNTRL